MGQIQLKHLQPAQYESWLRKAEDPEWNGEEFGCSTRSKSERAAASLALELRDHLAAMAAKDEQIRQLREALRQCAHKIDQHLQGQYSDGKALGAALIAARKALLEAK